MGRDFLGCYDVWNEQLVLMERSRSGMPGLAEACNGLEDPRIKQLLSSEALQKLRDDVDMAGALCKPFDAQAYRDGHMTPVFFGSAVNNFGVRELLNGLVEQAPTPRAQPCVERVVDPTETKVTGIVFKIQANMDPKHRDRVAFMRLASGHFKRGMKLKHVRSGKQMTIHNPVMFLHETVNLPRKPSPVTSSASPIM